MRTKTAFNPFQHTTLFFLFGVLCSLVIVQCLINWNGPVLAKKILDIPPDNFPEFIPMEIHTEKQKAIAPIKQPAKTPVVQTTAVRTEVIEVPDTKMTLDKFNIQATDIEPIQNPIVIEEANANTAE
ncbi:MAG: hypothetical protein ACK4IY_09290, partial [Chitinophagales bacterium]